MHDSLLPERLGQIQNFQHRRLATRALNGSYQDLEDLCFLAADLSAADSKLFLPVFYALLDPARIPSAVDMDVDSISPNCQLSLRLALLSLKCFSLLRRVLEIASEFWPRVWEWTNFLQIYSSFVGVPEWEVGRAFLEFLPHMRHDAPRFLDATPGVHCVFARAWAGLYLGDDENLGPYNFTLEGRAHFDGVAFFLSYEMKPLNPARFAQLVEGAGGTPADLAALVIKHINHFIPQKPHEIMPERNMVYLITVLKFVQQTNDGPEGVFNAVLLSHGIIQALTAIFVRLTETVDCPPMLFDSCFALLTRKLAKSDHGWMREALKAGLLRGIILCSSHLAQLDRNKVTKFVREELSFSTVYYPIVSQMEVALQEIESLQNTATFRSSAVFGDWQAFVKLARKRIALKQQFDSGEYKSLRACDNLECGVIVEKTNLQRCSTCLTGYYCSRNCQALDWSAGHRKACERIRAARPAYPGNFTTRQVSFMRAILNQDYQDAKLEICAKQVACMAADPTARIYTSFDYTLGPVMVPTACMYIPHIGEPFGYLAAEWKYVARRAVRSNGRLELHLMCVADRGKAIYRIFPMRVATNGQFKEIRRIAAHTTVAAASDPMSTVGTEISALVSRHAGVVAKH